MLLIEKIARRQPKINLWMPLFAYAKIIQQKYPSWAYHEWLVQLQIAPNVGLEPTTTRLRVLRSADWANRARRTCVVQTNSQINIHSLFPDLYHLSFPRSLPPSKAVTFCSLGCGREPPWLQQDLNKESRKISRSYTVQGKTRTTIQI
jgi:hypothetical protein